MKAVKSNMKDQILTSDCHILHCPACDAEASGNKGDYFLMPEDFVFHCGCGEEMELVRKVVTVSYED